MRQDGRQRGLFLDVRWCALAQRDDQFGFGGFHGLFLFLFNSNASDTGYGRYS